MLSKLDGGPDCNCARMEPHYTDLIFPISSHAPTCPVSPLVASPPLNGPNTSGAFLLHCGGLCRSPWRRAGSQGLTHLSLYSRCVDGVAPEGGRCRFRDEPSPLLWGRTAWAGPCPGLSAALCEALGPGTLLLTVHVAMATMLTKHAGESEALNADSQVRLTHFFYF